MSQLHHIVDFYRMAVAIILITISASASAVENIERVFIFGDQIK